MTFELGGIIGAAVAVVTGLVTSLLWLGRLEGRVRQNTRDLAVFGKTQDCCRVQQDHREELTQSWQQKISADLGEIKGTLRQIEKRLNGGNHERKG